MVRTNETTTTSATSRRGSTRAPARRRTYTKSRSPSSTFTSPRGATSNHETHTESLAPEQYEGGGTIRRLQGRWRDARHVLPRDARRPQRGADRALRRSGGVRARLSRGHLRVVRVPDQRRAARPAP